MASPRERLHRVLAPILPTIPNRMARMHSSLSRLLILGLLLLGLAACGSKGPLVPADEAPAKTEPPAQ